MTAPSWLTAFLDFPADRYDAGVAFWERVTGYQRSAPRGEHDEFATLVPPDGDDYLRVQRLASGGPRIHLDLQVDDVAAAGAAAERLGAGIAEDHGDHQVLRSPGGFTFCL